MISLDICKTRSTVLEAYVVGVFWAFHAMAFAAIVAILAR